MPNQPNQERRNGWKCYCGKESCTFTVEYGEQYSDSDDPLQQMDARLTVFSDAWRKSE